MKEEFLHYLWKYSLYDTDQLQDNENNKIIVIHPGEYNRDAGPDFFNARLIIDGTLWAGNVEVHIKASHFDNHGHNVDQSYDNVILHVVADNDKKIFNTRGEEILTSRLIFDPLLYDKYTSLINNPYIIACQDEIGLLDKLYIRHWLTFLAIERLEEKTGNILNIFSETGNDWDETFYRLLTRYFGFRVNTEPFEMLANVLPFKVIRKHSDNLFQIEALLFGSAGMLEEALFKEAIHDEYYLSLIREYKILRTKYSLQSVHGWLWKYARLRPANFPTVRISQLASMLSVAGGLFSKVIEAGEISGLRSLFEVQASEYWDDHYVFGRKSRRYSKVARKQATDILIINAVIPLLFAYGRHRDSGDKCEMALSLLEDTDPEDNAVIREWLMAGVESESALITQALLQLRNNYCRKRRCLECRIGSMLIEMGRKLKKQDDLILEP